MERRVERMFRFIVARTARRFHLLDRRRARAIETHIERF